MEELAQVHLEVAKLCSTSQGFQAAKQIATQELPEQYSDLYTLSLTWNGRIVQMLHRLLAFASQEERFVESFHLEPGAQGVQSCVRAEGKVSRCSMTPLAWL